MAERVVGPVFPYNRSVFGTTFGCEYFGSVTSKGLFQGDDPLKYSLPVLLLQLGTAVLMTSILRRILRPLHQPRFVAEMLTGILLGPSVMQHFQSHQFIGKFSTIRQSGMVTFFEFFSLIMFEYLVSIQTDFNVIKNSGKLAWIIGLSAFALPNLLSIAVSTVLGTNYPTIASQLNQVSMFSSITSFHVTSILLDDLKLLNSEIGRLAISSSLISSICGYAYTNGKNLFLFGTLFKYTTWDYFKTQAPRFLYILLAIFGLRPFMFWMIRKIPEGKSLKQWQFCVMILMVLIGAIYNESFGYTAIFGSVVLGLVVPKGPPLASGMLEKMTLFVSVVLVPSYIISAGHHVDVFLVSAEKFKFIMMVILATTTGKILAAVLPMKFFRVPNKDAISLGLILSSQGFFDVLIVKRALTYQLFDQEQFTIITIMILVNAAIATPILRYLYDPSKRYINYKRRTVQHSRHESEFKILVCVHEEDDVFSLMNVLKASYPSTRCPIRIYVLDLMELIGRISPIFINHRFHNHCPPTARTNRTDRIISAFQQFEMHQEGFRHQNFTSIAPYASMHDEICTMALDKSVCLVIIPFHKSEAIGMRGVKRNVLDKAPCSIGILVDKKIVPSWRSNTLNFNVCVVFLGGPDAREALAYAMRMMENPSTRLTVIRLIGEDEFISDLLETKLDMRAITELRSMYADTDDEETDQQRFRYKEVVVNDGAHTIDELRTIDEEYDFILVGRRLDADSPLVAGLADWTYEPELGIVGDILASPDMKSNASVLVIQQQSTVEDLLNIDKAKKFA